MIRPMNSIFFADCPFTIEAQSSGLYFILDDYVADTDRNVAA